MTSIFGGAKKDTRNDFGSLDTPVSSYNREYFSSRRRSPSIGGALCGIICALLLVVLMVTMTQVFQNLNGVDYDKPYFLRYMVTSGSIFAIINYIIAKFCDHKIHGDNEISVRDQLAMYVNQKLIEQNKRNMNIVGSINDNVNTNQAIINAGDITSRDQLTLGSNSAYDMGWDPTAQAGAAIGDDENSAYNNNNNNNNNTNSNSNKNSMSKYSSKHSSINHDPRVSNVSVSRHGLDSRIPSYRMRPRMTACEKCRFWFLPAMFLNLFNVLGGWLAYKSIETTSVDVNNTIFQGQAVFTYFGSAIFLQTQILCQKNVGLVLSVAGIILVSFAPNARTESVNAESGIIIIDNNKKYSEQSDIIGVVLCLLSAILYAGYQIGISHFGRKFFIYPPTFLQDIFLFQFMLGLTALLFYWPIIFVFDFASIEKFEWPSDIVANGDTDLLLAILAPLGFDFIIQSVLIFSIILLDSSELVAFSQLLIIPLLFVIDFMIYHDNISLNGIIGSGLIVVAFLIMEGPQWKCWNDEDGCMWKYFCPDNLRRSVVGSTSGGNGYSGRSGRSSRSGRSGRSGRDNRGSTLEDIKEHFAQKKRDIENNPQSAYEPMVL